MNELGSILTNEASAPIPAEYWPLSGALYAYTYLGLANLGIDIVGESQLVGYPTQYPSVSMINWTNGRPNARYWVLKLLKDNFAPGDKFVDAGIKGNEPDAQQAITLQAVSTPRGKRLLLINKRNRTVRLVMPPELKGSKIGMVDPSTGDERPAEGIVGDQAIELKPFAVAVVGG